MKINLKPNLEIPRFPLPIYSVTEIGDAISKDGDNFYIFAGLDEKMVSQLKILSLDKNDTEIQKNTSDLKRFGIGLYEDWYKKNRTPFALVQKNTNKLAALIWFGPESLDGNKGNFHTSAWRSYPSFRGKGLMKEFARFVMDIYAKNTPDIKFWITVKKENAGSIGFAKALGFLELSEASNDTSLIMVK